LDNLQLWDFRFIDFVDVFLVAILLYYIYRLVKGTVAVNIFIGILIIYFAWRLTDYLNMYMLYSIFDGFMKVGIIALIVVFQPEIRKFLLLVGSTNIAGKKRAFQNFKFLKNDDQTTTDVEAIVKACTKMAASNTGR
jgi:diadenylate cyclase